MEEAKRNERRAQIVKENEQWLRKHLKDHQISEDVRNSTNDPNYNKKKHPEGVKFC